MISAVPDIYEGFVGESEMMVMISDGGYEKFSNFEIKNILHVI